MIRTVRPKPAAISTLPSKCVAMVVVSDLDWAFGAAERGTDGYAVAVRITGRCWAGKDMVLRLVPMADPAETIDKLGSESEVPSRDWYLRAGGQPASRRSL
jgi:hypothetical protein